jgi:hypothetical protein
MPRPPPHPREHATIAATSKAAAAPPDRVIALAALQVRVIDTEVEA